MLDEYSNHSFGGAAVSHGGFVQLHHDDHDHAAAFAVNSSSASISMTNSARSLRGPVSFDFYFCYF
jgi:hypothetical protein